MAPDEDFQKPSRRPKMKAIAPIPEAEESALAGISGKKAQQNKAHATSRTGPKKEAILAVDSAAWKDSRGPFDGKRRSE